MTDSASANLTRTPRVRAISRAAQELVAERGWSQVTVDDIAARAGTSRRTFFNHVDSKESAVLGALPHLTDELATRLREEALGPGEDLLEITLRVAAATVSAQETEVEDWRRLHDVLVRNPELIPRFHERLEALFDALVEHLSARPDVTGEQARVVLTAAAAVFQLSVEDALDRPALGGFDDRLQTNLALLRQAAGAPRT